MADTIHESDIVRELFTPLLAPRGDVVHLFASGDETLCGRDAGPMNFAFEGNDHATCKQCTRSFYHHVAMLKLEAQRAAEREQERAATRESITALTELIKEQRRRADLLAGRDPNQRENPAEVRAETAALRSANEQMEAAQR